MRAVNAPPQAVSVWRREQDEAREENLREHTQTYVTEGCRSATKYCDADTKRNYILEGTPIPRSPNPFFSVMRTLSVRARRKARVCPSALRMEQSK